MRSASTTGRTRRRRKRSSRRSRRRAARRSRSAPTSRVEADVVRLFDTVDARWGRSPRWSTTPASSSADAGRAHRRRAIDRVFATNVTRRLPVRARSGAAHVDAHGGTGGAIVNVSSRAAQLGAPGEYVDYAASKAALDALTIGLAREVADEGIRVNGVRPGIIYTEIHADGGEPGRVDRARAHAADAARRRAR